jgi:hypothetical protein
MNRCKTLVALSVALAAVAAAPAAAHPRTQTITDAVGDTAFPSLDIVRATLRADSRYVYVTIETAARLTDEPFWPIVTMSAFPRDPDSFYTAFGASPENGVWDANGGPNNTTGPVWVHRSGRRGVAYRFRRTSIRNLSPFEWNVITVAPNGEQTDWTATRVYHLP